MKNDGWRYDEEGVREMWVKISYRAASQPRLWLPWLLTVLDCHCQELLYQTSSLAPGITLLQSRKVMQRVTLHLKNVNIKNILKHH